jgi:SAM-dependent methyltransferase
MLSMSQGMPRQNTAIARGQSGATPRALDVGCGRHKVPGTLGLDSVRLAGVDVVADLARAGLPFPDNTFDALQANHLLEHMVDLPAVLAEFHRVCRPGASIHVLVPYFTCIGAFGNPTHVRFFTYRTLEHFTDGPNDPERHTWFSITRFAIRRRIGFGKLFRLLGIEWAANRFPNIYENFFAFLWPARTRSVELIVLADRA